MISIFFTSIFIPLLDFSGTQSANHDKQKQIVADCKQLLEEMLVQMEKMKFERR